MAGLEPWAPIIDSADVTSMERPTKLGGMAPPLRSELRTLMLVEGGGMRSQVPAAPHVMEPGQCQSGQQSSSVWHVPPTTLQCGVGGGGGAWQTVSKGGGDPPHLVRGAQVATPQHPGADGAPHCSPGSVHAGCCRKPAVAS